MEISHLSATGAFPWIDTAYGLDIWAAQDDGLNVVYIHHIMDEKGIQYRETEPQPFEMQSCSKRR